MKKHFNIEEVKKEIAEFQGYLNEQAHTSKCGDDEEVTRTILDGMVDIVGVIHYDYNDDYNEEVFIGYGEIDCDIEDYEYNALCETYDEDGDEVVKHIEDYLKTL